MATGLKLHQQRQLVELVRFLEQQMDEGAQQVYFSALYGEQNHTKGLIAEWTVRDEVRELMGSCDWITR